MKLNPKSVLMNITRDQHRRQSLAQGLRSIPHALGSMTLNRAVLRQSTTVCTWAFQPLVPTGFDPLMVP